MPEHFLNRVPLLVVVLAGLFTAGAAGCAGTKYAQLREESSVPELAALRQETLAHPNHTALVPTFGVTGKGMRVAVAVHQIEAPGHDRLLVFIHGVFSDSSAWRFIVGDLARDHDLWLVDLPGCGNSDKPDPEKMGPDAYSPSDLGARVLEALRNRLAARGGDQHFTLVGHSLGGMVAIRMFSDDGLRDRYADVLNRIDRMVLSAPVDAALNRPDPLFEQIATISPLEIGMGAATGVLRERVADAIINSVNDPATRALREEADQRVEFLKDPPTRKAMQAMLRNAVAWKSNKRPDWVRNEAVVEGYRYVRPECLLLWGSRDEVLSPSMGYKLAVELPQAHLLLLPNVMHSPHIEVPVEDAALIRAFADSGEVPPAAASPSSPNK